MRRKFSCPDCGWLPKSYDEKQVFEAIIFNCPRCKSVFSEMDFIEENEFKWSKSAELSYEENI